MWRPLVTSGPESACRLLRARLVPLDGSEPSLGFLSSEHESGGVGGIDLDKRLSGRQTVVPDRVLCFFFLASGIEAGEASM